ncbi:DHH family phosphoesterase [Candidatus Saccharibacteria bacterium]|nr:DHH family phosphoesterase [Candidatus Saccharibacteria bacterium]
MKKSETGVKISSIVATILKQRGFKAATEQQDFLNPSYDRSKHDPFLMWGMREAVNRIIAAKENSEKITIYGDYDIDGMTATVILWESLKKFGLEVKTYTPDRFTEGYGLNVTAVEQIAKDGTKLIITVDNGTLSFDEIARAKELGVDVIVTDHHSPHDELPDAVAILNPKIAVSRQPDAYDEKFLLKNNQKPVIAVDIDDVLSDTANWFIAESKQRWNCDLTIDEYSEGWGEVWKVDRDEWRRRYLEFVGDEEYLKKIKPIDLKSSLAVLRELKKNHKLVILSSRPQEVHDQTRKWIKKYYNGIFEEIIFVDFWNETGWNRSGALKTKAEICVKIGADFLIDDQPKHVNSLEKCATKGILFGDYPWQKVEISPVAENVRNWHEIKEYFSKESSRKESYPFADLCGAGVAFKLVQALQRELDGLPDGNEKWLLDLVALGTVCDVVGLVNENRANVKWGLEVLKKTRRPGLRALLATANVEPKNINARTLGFVIGPRLNAAGRLETAEMALELLKLYDTPDDPEQQDRTNARALELAQKLDDLNKERRKVQDEIFIEACTQIVETDNVAIAAGDDWHEGVIGIVAAKILEKFEKPTFVLSCGAEFAKGSGRSFGEFSCAAAIHYTDTIIEKGGGHLAAGGLTVRTERVTEWKTAIQTFYKFLDLKNQKEFLYPASDLTLMTFSDLTMGLLDEIEMLEPFGQANQAPVFEFVNVVILTRRTMGKNNEHVKYTFADNDGRKFTAVAFGAAEKFTLTPYDSEGQVQHATILVELMANEWNGRTTIEGRLIKLSATS